ncbi:MAG TPA: hypothetical protein VF742_02685 [Terracidiphilus sp.]
MLRGEQETVAEKSAADAEGALCGDARQLRKIVALGEMAKDDVCRSAVVGGFKELRGGIV